MLEITLQNFLLPNYYLLANCGFLYAVFIFINVSKRINFKYNYN